MSWLLNKKNASRRLIARYWLIGLGLLFFIQGLLGCATLRRPMIPMARIEGAKRPYFPGQILNLRDKRLLNYSQLIHRLSGADVVFIGEIHDNPDHHLIQAQVLQSLISKWGKLVLAVEFLPYTMQPTIDKYLAGGLSEPEFLRKVNWEDTWGFDYHFYRPLMQLAKQANCHIIGINAPHELVKKVARKGLAALTPDERNRLPREIDLTDTQHKEYLRKVYESHEHNKIKEFDYFYQAQCVWEETMADNIANYLEHGNEKIVVLCGNGHIYYDFGIPKRLRRRIGAQTATLIPYPLETKTLLKNNTGDFLWLTGKYLRLSHMRHRKKAEE